MKIGEAWQRCSEQTNDLWEKRRELLKQQKKLSETADRKQELDSVTLQISEVDEKFDIAQKFMEELLQQKNLLHDASVAKQQGDAMKKASEDMAKCIETARRIASGARVPSSDIQKLMEFSPEMYMQAVNAAAMNKNKEKEEYDSLWADEDQAENPEQDIDTEVNNTECCDQPQISE